MSLTDSKDSYRFRRNLFASIGLTLFFLILCVAAIYVTIGAKSIGDGWIPAIFIPVMAGMAAFSAREVVFPDKTDILIGRDGLTFPVMLSRKHLDWSQVAKLSLKEGRRGVIRLPSLAIVTTGNATVGKKLGPYQAAPDAQYSPGLGFRNPSWLTALEKIIEFAPASVDVSDLHKEI